MLQTLARQQRSGGGASRHSMRRAEAITESKGLGLDLYRYVKKMERHHRVEPVSGYPSSCLLAGK
jgi:hypothetical protein